MPGNISQRGQRAAHGPRPWTSRTIPAWGLSLAFAVAVPRTAVAAEPAAPQPLEDDLSVLTDPLEGTKGKHTPVPDAVSPLRRLALVVGANDGGPKRTRLRYATSDADTLSRVLQNLGGTRGLDMTQLRDPSAQDLEEAFERLRETAVELDDEATLQVVFYYSGHSDEQGLLLGDERVEYRTLRRWIDRIPADVRIAILDSCASGAFTRLKGGTKTTPFLVSPSNDVKGHAFLTSSSEDEAAQESDRIGGSFFTHYLTTGLRGAADRNGDRLITLNEAYQFAFDETLARTEATRAGPQHAAYEIQLSGSGDLVMTDLRKTTGRLELAAPLEGRISVRSAQGFLAAELYKVPGNKPVLLALEPGPYRVTVDNGERLWLAEVEVTSQGRGSIDASLLVPLPHEQTIQRGATVLDDGLTHIPANAGLFPPFSINGQSKKARIINNFSASFLWSRAAVIDGVSLSFGVGVATELVTGAQLSMLGNLNRGYTQGVQITLGFNASSALRGAQLGLVNHSRELERGAQLGVVNSAGASSGVQLGLINVGGNGSTVQIGLINAAKQADAQFGLVSGTREGNVHPEVWTSDIAVINVGLRLPARYTYGLVAGGLSPLGNGHDAWLFSMGFGGHVPLPRDVFIDVELTSSAVASGLQFHDAWGLLEQLRVSAGWNPRPRVSLFAGPSLNVLIDRFAKAPPQEQADDARDVNRPGYGWVQYDSDTKRYRVRVWAGFQAGMRF